MVYIHSWQEYQDAAEALYSKSPGTTRYCVKWKSSEGKLVLKITDNTTCIKFKTYSSVFLNRFEALNLSLMKKMQNKHEIRPPPAAAPTAAATETKPQSHVETPSPGTAPPASSTMLTSGGPVGGGVKKKKPKKK